MAQLTKEVTNYTRGHVSDVLYYSSARTIEQYKKIRMHPMCKLGLSFIKLGLPDVPPTFSGIDDDQVAITEAVFKVFWGRLIRNSLEEIDYGFKAMELRWEPGKIVYFDKDENMKTFEGILPKLPKSLDGEGIEILIEKNGSFRGFWQDGDTSRMCLAKDRKALLFTNQLESGNYYGISDMDSIYPYWFDANMNRQFHMRWLERKGTGLYLGSYPSGKTEDIDNADIMMDLLNNIVEGVVVSVPSEADEKGNKLWDIKLLEGQDKNNTFIEHAKYLDETILKGLVIPEKALTQGEIGARASVEAFQSMFVTRKQDLLEQTVDVIDRYFIKNFVELNFGSDARINVAAGKLDDNSVYVANTIIQKLIEKGSVEVEQSWLIEKTGIPLIEKEEEPVEEPEEDSVEEEEIEPEDGEIEEQDKEEAKGKVKMAENRWSAMTKREKMYRLNEVDSYLTERSAQFERDMGTDLMKAFTRIKSYIEKSIGKEKPIVIANGISINKGPIRTIYKSLITDMYDYMFSHIQSTVEGETRMNARNEYIDFRYKLNADKMLTEIEASIKNTASNGLLSEYSVSEIIANIKTVITNFVTTRIPTIANTETGFAIGKANEDYYRINKELVRKGILPPARAITRYEYSAVMDSATTDLCAELNGTIVDEDSPILSKYSTPNHYNCRSIWLPITAEEVSDAGYHTDLTIDPSTRRPISVDGLTASLGPAAVKQRTF